MPADALAIAGLVPLSTVDWPGRLAATVFCQGCPWRCVYCHNEAILDPRAPGAVPFAELEALLGRRRGLLDGVVFSGGEATMQPAVVDAARRVRSLGFKVGLHTGGAYPRRLGQLLDEGLLDWIGFDLKAPAGLYGPTVGRAGAWLRAADAVRLAVAAQRAGRVEVEFRSTVTPMLAGSLPALVHEAADLGIGELILQQARPDGAPAGFARALPEPRTWARRFAEAARAAQEHGADAGVRVRVRQA